MPNAAVTVFVTGTRTLAPLFSDDGITPTTNPVFTNAQGVFDFYVADGRYDIQVSGANISTFTQTNVEISDITQASSSDLNWQTEIVGFVNQPAPPAQPSPGLLNVFSQQNTKHLYIQDETGLVTDLTAGGGSVNNPGLPVNSLQKNSGSATFTGSSLIDNGQTVTVGEDIHFKGPNPSFDISQYSGYFYTGVQPSTTGSIGASSASLSLASALDFANGQGILVLGAGPATSLATPTGVTVSQQNVTGSTSYSYVVVAEDYANGRTASSAPGTTTTGPANLGAFTAAAISNCTRAGGIVTCTTTSPHNLAPFSFIELSGTGNVFYNGTATLLTASGTTFTYPQQGQLDDATGISTGTVKALAINVVQWTEVDYTVLRSYIYRCVGGACAFPANASNYTLAGVTQGMDGGFLDYGYAVTASQIANGDIPATAPTAAGAQWLPTTIVSGGGTGNLTLATTASTAVLNAKVLHDNTPVFSTVCSAMASTVGSGGRIYIPNGNGSFSGPAIFPINSTLNFNSAGCSSIGYLELDVAATIAAAGSVIPRTRMKIKGLASRGHSPNFYGVGIDTSWSGSAYPFLYMLPGTSSNVNIESFDIQAFRPYESAVVQDQDGGGNNVTSIRYRDVHLVASNAPAYILGGGFGFFWEYGGWSTGGTASFATQPAVWLKANYGLGRLGNSQLPGIFSTLHTYMFGGMLWDAAGQVPLTSVGLSATFTDMLAESSYGPMMRLRAGSNPFGGVFTAFSYSDFLGGGATPLIDAVNGSIQGLQLINPGCGAGTQPMFQANTNPGFTTNVDIITSEGGGCSIVGLPSYTLNGNVFVNTPGLTSGSLGQFAYSMPVPGAPASAIVSAGGSVPVGTNVYTLAAIDANANLTTVGPGITATTTPGNQTVTITVPNVAPPGATGYALFRNGIYTSNVGHNCSNFFSFTSVAPGTSYVDTSGSACGNSVPGQNLAGLAAIGASGLSGYQLSLTPMAFVNLPAASNGVLINCLDCLQGSNPCTGGGTGAIAERLNGQWFCGGAPNNSRPLPNTGLFFEARAIVGQTSLQTIGDASTNAQNGGTTSISNGAFPTSTTGVVLPLTIGGVGTAGFNGWFPTNSSNNANGIFRAGRNNRYQARIQTLSAAGVVTFLGFSTGTPSTLRTFPFSGSTSYLGLYTPGVGSSDNWQATINGSTVNTGVAVTANLVFVDITMNDTANTASFSINGGAPLTISGSNPSGFNWFPVASFASNNNGLQSFALEYFYAQQDF